MNSSIRKYKDSFFVWYFSIFGTTILKIIFFIKLENMSIMTNSCIFAINYYIFLMKITHKSVNTTNMILEIKMVESDYSKSVNESLLNYQKKNEHAWF